MAKIENYGTIWVCVCCMLRHVNGECCTHGQHEEDGTVPLSAIEAPFTVALGMAREEHDNTCAVKCTCTHDDDCEEHGDDPEAHHDPADHVYPDDYECDCATNTYSTSQCAGCGSWLHGERHAMTLFKN
jgi:hypothetical protein